MGMIRQAATDWGSDVWRAWNRFWFTPSDPATYALLRMLGGAMILYTHLVWTLDLDAFFGPESWVSPQAHEELFGREFLPTPAAAPNAMPIYRQTYLWSHFWWFESAKFRWAMHATALVACAMLTVGWHGRMASVTVFLFTVSYIHRAPEASFGLDQLNCFIAMYLMIGPCSARYSLDRLFARRRHGGSLPHPAPSVGANVGIRLLQIHMCVIYLFAGIGKLRGPAWWSGYAMWQSFANLEYQSLDMTWAADWPVLLTVMCHVTIFWECTYWALIWSRLTRPIVLLLAIPLHLGIAVCMGMITFGLVMLIGNAAFLPPQLVRALLDHPAWANWRRRSTTTNSELIPQPTSAPRIV